MNDKIAKHPSQSSTKSLWTENSVSSFYSSSYYDYGILDKFDHFLEVGALLEHVDSNFQCLDLAAGNGRFTEALLEKGCRVTFVDLEEKHVKNAARRFNNSDVEIVCADAVMFLDTETRLYDLIVLSGIILFLDDAQATFLLQKAKNRLTPGGIIFIRDFVAKKTSFSIDSSIFEEAKLYYRTKSFFHNLNAEEFFISRPCHRLIRLEKVFAAIIGYTFYKFIFTRHLVKKLTWAGYGYENMIFIVRN